MKKNAFVIILLICSVSTVVAIIAYWYNFRLFRISQATDDWGNFGSYVSGVVGTIFSFASVILIYLTFKKQQETSILQQFETTFFNLLGIQREMMKSVKGKFNVGENVEEISGEEFFIKFSEQLLVDYTFIPTDLNAKKSEVRNVIMGYYNDRFEQPGPTLGPYYRHLYHFLKYTNSSEIYNKKQKYMDIIQSQMSDAELYCLFYNAICYGKERLHPLLETYGFLENIESKSVVFDFHKKIFYPQTKFKYHTKDVPLAEIE